MSRATRSPWPVSLGETNLLGQAFWRGRFVPAQPVVEDHRRELGVDLGECLQHQPQCGRREFPSVADRGEQGHVAPLDRPVHGALQRLDVGNIDVFDIDTFFG